MSRYLGEDHAKAVEFCPDAAPATNDVLKVDPLNPRKAFSGKTITDNVADSAITGAKVLSLSLPVQVLNQQIVESGAMSAGMWQQVNGAAVDGDVVLDNVSTYPFASKSGGTYTLLRDVSLATLSIPSVSTVIKPNGFRLFVRDRIHVQGTGTLQINAPGTDALSTSTATGAVGAAGAATGTLGGGAAGGAGGNGTTGAGLAGVVGVSIHASKGGNGGAGGAGAGTFGAGAGPGGIIVSTSAFDNLAGGVMMRATESLFPLNGGSGGGGGGGGGGVGPGGGGGGGGGGGVISVVAGMILIDPLASMLVDARGGAGGTSDVALTTRGGGGGGGGGGVIFIAARRAYGVSYINVGSTNLFSRRNGAVLICVDGGIGGGGAVAGAAGAAGTAIVIDYGTAVSPTAQAAAAFLVAQQEQIPPRRSTISRTFSPTKFV